MPEDEEMQPEEGKTKKKKMNMKSMMSTAFISMIMAFLVLYFAGPMVVGNNQKQKEKAEQATKQRIPITAVLIGAGSNQTFVLKGAKDVAVVDSLVFKVGSDACRAAIADDKPLIMDALMKIFISKSKAELATPAGLELLKKQIKEAVELITGCSGNDGVLVVYLYIKAFATTE